jgi:hypothetical protein
MNQEQAKKLIKDTFEHAFDKARFIIFIKNLLNSIDESKAFQAHAYIKESFQNIIKTYERIGSYESPDGKKIDIIIVYLQKEFSVNHARVTQRNFAGKYLSDRGEKDAGLFAFVAPNEADWRFSLVKMDYDFKKTPDGKPKVVTEFSPARRWSFLVGENEQSHTAQSQLVKLIVDDEHNPVLTQLEEAFNIEKVTNEFFLEYRNLFIRTKEALDEVVEKNPSVKSEFEAKGVNTVDFAKKLLGQIVFLYFLQKKGWFGVGRDDNWGTGSKKFLRELFEKRHSNYSNFFNDILEPLFYEALRIDRSYDDDYYSRFNCKIPFLNGGLFDPIGNYDWVHIDITLPDNLFSNDVLMKVGDTGNGILDIFDRYNFTVREDEPLEKEVAIDPELLGKAYEKFNAIRPDNFGEYKKVLKSGEKGSENKFNKQYGVYYTPREIVHYMCQQSLIHYLLTELNGKTVSYERVGKSNLDMFGNKIRKGQLDITIEHKNLPTIPKEDIEMFIQLGEQFRENDEIALKKEEQIHNGSQNSSSIKTLLPESIRKNALLIDEKLANITICDPAVGSGAFPVGMMNEIIKARTVITPYIKDEFRSAYNFKHQCIEKSLYGVDIDPGAVEIAKLRLWLSLIVEEEDFKEIKPLPNLDYKVVCGDSLLGYPYVPRGLEKIEKFKIEFFNETNPLRKNILKQQVNDAIYNLYKNTNRSLGYKVNFDFKINFSEIFRKQDGFDVVIANPPYINTKRGIEAFLKNSYNKIYKSAQGQFDLFTLFIEKGINITKNELTYIIPKPFINNENYKTTRDLVLNSGLYEIVIGSGVFEKANVESCLLFSSKKDQSKRILIMNFDKGKFKKHNIIEKQIYKKLPFNMFNTEINSKDIKIFEKMDRKFIKLEKIINITRGVECGKNDKIITSQKTPFKLLRGEDVQKYLINYKNIFIKFSEKEPKKYKCKSLYFTNKILIRRVSKDLICTIDYNNFVVLNTLYCCTLKNNFNQSYITAVLNSKLISYWFKKMFVLTDKLFPYIRKSQLNFIPIKNISQNEQKSFEKLVERIISITSDKNYLSDINRQAEVYKCECLINKMVYKLYNLSPEEIEIVEGT